MDYQLNQLINYNQELKAQIQKISNEKLKLEAGHGLVQLTVTLRNLADLPNTRQKFLALNLMEQLVNVLKYYTSDGELMLNVSRILRFG